MTRSQLTQLIRLKIAELGFDAFKIIPCRTVDNEYASFFKSWLDNGHQAEMKYMQNNIEKRLNPNLLVDNAKTMLVFALNYYPSTLQNSENPQIAYYAYGEDYHEVIKKKLKILYTYIQSLQPNTQGRYFCDTAPVLERYWAQYAKMGWIGKNTMLILPKKGSYFFLACILLDIVLDYDEIETSKMPTCGNCTKCIDACPTHAIVAPYQLDANKCISYQTIENKSDTIPESISKQLSNKIYGCDICQQVCPWNRFAHPNSTTNFVAKQELLSLSLEQYCQLSQEDYTRIFSKSPIKRAKLTGITRNAFYLKNNQQNEKND